MNFRPQHPFLVGIDSDGCVFDSQGVKQIGHFHPMIIRHWGLESLETEVRALGEYLNLRSPMRGTNRFHGLLRLFELLQETQAYGVSDAELPSLSSFREWLGEEVSPSERSLAAVAGEDPMLRSVLEWSQTLTQDIAENMAPIPPFPGAAEALQRMRESADLVVVSLTGQQTLEEEWSRHGIRPFVDEILGMEAGPKTVQLSSAIEATGVDPRQVLMIGDAPGDLKAARETGVCFFPTIPGEEADCWTQLLEEEFEVFLRGEYSGARMENWVERFEASLSGKPPEGL